MNIELHPDERAIYLHVLKSRVDRLARMLKSGDIGDRLLGMYVGHLVRAAIPICGDPARDEIFTWLIAKFREDQGLCPFDGRPKAVPSPLCAECIKECDALDQELQLHDADERNPM